MNAIKKRLGLVVGGLVVAAGVLACEATRERDVSISFKFAPDMVIRSKGLEDTLGDLADLLDKCITGTFSRPCTAEEMSAINEAIDTVAAVKARLGEPEVPTPGGSTGA